MKKSSNEILIHVGIYRYRCVHICMYHRNIHKPMHYVPFPKTPKKNKIRNLVNKTLTLKAGVELLRWLWGAIAQHLQLKQDALGSIPGSYPGFFH